jgi:hypothetical protein
MSEEFDKYGNFFDGMFPCLNCPCPWRSHIIEGGCDNILYEDQETGQQQQCMCGGFVPDNLMYIEMVSHEKEVRQTDLF